ncbi:MAG: tRNA pseudouridine(38-40) synthase TruA [Actinomycetota bacterium]|nr:tRNA pseudouridine(38-40) synthase TruA [Actinomycetota bacterium]
MTTPLWRASSSSSTEPGGAALTLFSEDAIPEAVTAAPTRRLRLLVAYDGRGYHGFAVQPGQVTVGGALVAALERYLRHTVELTCAGRTDSGVHAWGQVVTFEARADAEPTGLQRAVNRALRPAIVVRQAAVAEPGFDARRSATGRVYRYSIWNDPVADPFTAGTAWHVPAPLDLSAMRLACDALHGEHDFSSFCRRPPVPDASLVRRVRDARWLDLGGGRLRFDIEASSFCHQMVRSVVGTLVEVGLGKRKAGQMTTVLGARSRAAAGQPAPAHGLCLWQVLY